MHKAKLQLKGESDWFNVCCSYNFARSVKFKHFKSLYLHNYLKQIKLSCRHLYDN